MEILISADLSCNGVTQATAALIRSSAFDLESIWIRGFTLQGQEYTFQLYLRLLFPWFFTSLYPEALWCRVLQARGRIIKYTMYML